MAIVEKALVAKGEYLLVFEDDSVFAPDFDSRFRETFFMLPPDWWALQLNWNAKNEGPSEVGLVGPAGHGSGMMANLWSREGLTHFYGHSWSRVNRIIDANYDDLRMRCPDHFHRPTRQLVTQDPLAAGGGRDG
jgi:GR25 family glycosyltransferase involved in LPS biosynthesis